MTTIRRLMGNERVAKRPLFHYTNLLDLCNDTLTTIYQYTIGKYDDWARLRKVSKSVCDSLTPDAYRYMHLDKWFRYVPMVVHMNLQHLRSVTMPRGYLHNDTPIWPSLTYLDMSGAQQYIKHSWEKHSWEKLGAMTNLRHLKLKHTTINSADMRLISTLPKLQILNVSSSVDIIPSLPPNIKKLLCDGCVLLSATSYTLTHLRICWGAASPHISQFCNLRELDITSSTIYDGFTRTIAEHKHLETLIMCNTNITDAGIREICTTDAPLQTIWIKNCAQLTYVCMSHLSDMQQLRNLHVANITSDWIRTMLHLNYINISDSPLITTNDIVHLMCYNMRDEFSDIFEWRVTRCPNVDTTML